MAIESVADTLALSDEEAEFLRLVRLAKATGTFPEFVAMLSACLAGDAA
jgi:hypothetical protein